MRVLNIGEVKQVFDIYDDGYLRVEHENFVVFCDKKNIKLPRTQFLILSRLAKSPERFVSSNELWSHVWGERKTYNSLSLHVYLYNLRRRLEPFDVVVETLTYVGYRLIPRQHDQNE